MTLNSVAINKLSYIEPRHSAVNGSPQAKPTRQTNSSAGKEVVVEYPVQLIHHQQ